MASARYYLKNGIHVVEVPVEAFRIKMVDKKKKSCGENVVNAGFFGNYSEGGDKFTLPAGHLVCDYEAESPHCLFYCNQRGKFNESKFSFDSSKWTYMNQFHGKAISTLIVRDDNVSIEDIKELPECDYAISGVPVMRHGEDCKFEAYVKAQGWGGSSLYATWHTFVGVKGDSNIIYVMAMKTKTLNMVKSSEAFKAFKELDLTDVIKLDGGGSFYFNADGTTKSTLENRRINSVITFDMGVDEKMDSQEFVKKAINIAENYKTLYVMGCFGAPLNSTNKKRYCTNHSYNKQSDRTKLINAASSDTFGFDCVNLIKAILWGWSGDKTKTYGGAKYTANGVPDINADTMITKCTNVSTDFSKIVEGAVVWMEGHIGIYIGNGVVIESTPKWTNGVLKSTCANIKSSKVSGTVGSRKWTKWGKLPYITYKTTTKEADTVEVTLPVLVKGSKGESVRALQVLLNGFGFSCGTADGSFGSNTLNAVKKFQTKNGLTVDGSVGKQTWNALLKQ